MKPERQRLNEFDGLRAIACCMVAFFWHYQHFGNELAYPGGKILGLLYKYGGTAVELFFIISGFAMTLNYAEKIANKETGFIPYIKKRYFKLWPLAFVTLILTLCLELIYRAINGNLFFLTENFDVYHFVLNAFLVQSGWFENSYTFNTPIWFVSVLLLCYIVFYGECIFAGILSRKIKAKSPESLDFNGMRGGVLALSSNYINSNCYSTECDRYCKI